MFCLHTVYYMCVWPLWKSEENVRYPGTDLPCGCWESTYILWKSSKWEVLTAESLLQPTTYCL